MKSFLFVGNPIPGRALPDREAAPQLAVLCLSGSLGGLELNSLKFAGWMQERGWRITFFAPPATPLAKWAEEWFVPLETLAVRRGLAMSLEQFAPLTRTATEARQELGLPLQGRLLGILGRFDEGKGQDFVLDALHHLRTRFGYDASLVIMGEPTRNESDAYLRQLQRQVARLGLTKQVHFRGFHVNPAVFYQAIDVFMMASENETYGMVTLEALAAGVPVVAAATGGTVELVQHGHTGLLCLSRDVAACAPAIRRIFEEPAATRQRVERAQLARWRYSHHRQCALTEDVIRMLREPAAPVPVPQRRPIAIDAAFAKAVA